MQLDVPKTVSFADCPAGTHAATFYQHKPKTKQTKRGVETLIRLIFQINDLSTESKLILVGRNFVTSLKPGSDLRQFLDCWLGPDFVESHQRGGKFDFDLLNDRHADVTVQRIDNEDYPEPYVWLVSAHPAGTLKTETYKDQQEGI